LIKIISCVYIRPAATDVANPLFVTQSRTESNTNEKRNAEWFDKECIEAQHLYKRALKLQFTNKLNFP